MILPNNLIPPTTPNHVASCKGFTYFVVERELIRKRRLLGVEAPWTDDPILNEYRFCNVRRRDDRVSQWLIHNLYSLSEEDLFFTTAISRLINWPPTIQALINSGVLPCSISTFNRQLFIDVIASHKKANDKSFTGAYMIFPTNKYAPKEVGVADTLKSIIKYAPDIRAAVKSNRVSNVVHHFTKCAGVGTFMGGQMAADLTYLHGQLDTAGDLREWAPLGPGSQQGLNMMMGLTKYKSWEQDKFNLNLKTMLVEYIDPLVKFYDGLPMTLHDVQNCFCEYSKYGRTILGTGRPRSKYTTQEGIF